MTTVHRTIHARAGIVALATFTALAAMLLSPTQGEAATTHTVSFDAQGGDKGNINARSGDTVVFKNALPLVPLTGAVAPVNVTLGGETFEVGAAPVTRTITQSTSYTGTYAVAGLVPLTRSSGTITVANEPPPPPPPPPPPTGGGAPPPAGGGANPPTTPGGGTGPNAPPGDPGNVPGGAGNATGPQLGSGTVNGQTPDSSGQVPPAVGPNAGSNSTLVPGRGGSNKQRALSNSSPTAGSLGLAAMLGAILLLGVGIALARTLISGRLDSVTVV